VLQRSVKVGAALLARLDRFTDRGKRLASGERASSRGGS
jgi:hypothetical protein